MNEPAQRLRASWAALDRDQRFAAGAAIALLATMFLPWYEKSFVVPGGKAFANDSISAFGAVSFVEAAIFLVAAGVIALVLARADGRPFELPGGDGTVILAAGVWATALIFYRVFDHPNVSGEASTVGIQWGFFVAFVAAGALAYAGQRIRSGDRQRTPARRPRSAPRRPEPDTTGTAIVPASEMRTEVVTHRGRHRGVSREDAEQLTFDEPKDSPRQPGEIPRTRDRG